MGFSVVEKSTLDMFGSLDRGSLLDLRQLALFKGPNTGSQGLKFQKQPQSTFFRGCLGS